MKRKAQTPGDAILIMFILLSLAIGGIVITYVYNEFLTEVLANPVTNATTEAVDAFQAGQTVNESWDFLLLFVFIGLAMGMLIIGYFIDVHSVFFPFYVIGILIGVVLAIVVSHVWTQVADTSTFTALKSSNFPITDHLLTNMPIYFTIISVMSFIATYAKTRGGNA